MKNFKEILDFKKANMEKTILIIGNHDYQYITEKERYSGFQAEHAEEIREIVYQSIKDGLLQVCYQQDKYLFSHAGFTNTWCLNNLGSEETHGSIDKQANDLMQIRPEAFKFTPSGSLDNVGDSITQSPIWVRPRALLSNKIEGCVQVVGHTHSDVISEKDGVFFIDVFDKNLQYLSIVIQEEVKSLPL